MATDLVALSSEIVIKGVLIAASMMGENNASIPTPQPVRFRPMFGGLGLAQARTRITFVSKAAFDNGIALKLGLKSVVYPVHGVRGLTKRDMELNDYLPVIEVDPETYVVKADGVELHCEPATELPLAQKYYLF